MGALVSSAVSAGDTATATAYNNLRTDASSHAARHITSTEDLIDGDKLDITYNASNYTVTSSPAEADDLNDLTAHLKGIDDAIGSVPNGVIQVSIVYADGCSPTGKGDHPGYFAGQVDEVYYGFVVPSDFSSIVSAKVSMIAASSTTYIPDIYSDYGASGEAYNAHSESKTDYSQALAADTIYFWDISSILSSLAADDKVGIKVIHQNPARSAYWMELIVEYT